MKLSLIFLLAFILHLSLFWNRLHACENILLSSEEVCQHLNVSSMIDIASSSKDNSLDFCPIIQGSTEKTILDHIYLSLEKIKNDFEVGFCYGLYIPVITGIVTTPLVLIFSKYVGNPYDKNMPNLHILLSLSDEEFLELVRKIWIPDYRLIIKASVVEEFVFRFIGFTAIEAHVKYLFKNLEYDSEEIGNKSQSFAITFSSIGFGLSHLLNPNPQPVQAFSATLSGFYFGYIYCNNGIISPLTAHIVNNVLLISIVRILRWYILRRLGT